MTYKKESTILIPIKRWEKVMTYIFNRFLETFGTDEEISQYLEGGKLTDRDSYYNRIIDSKDWILSVADYQVFLDWIIDNLPKKFNKKEAKKTLPIIDLYMWPITIESANQRKEWTSKDKQDEMKKE